MGVFRPSIEYIPEDLREEDLFVTATTLIDAVRRRTEPAILQDMPDEVNGLLPVFTDKRAVLAYYNMFVRPSIGTKSAMLYILKILKVNADFVEWFEADFNLPAYKFSLDFPDYPDDLNIDLLIDLINAFKSERSRLGVIRQLEGFQDMLVLDDNNIDYALLDDVSGTDYRGVNVFLQKRHTEEFVVDPIIMSGMLTEIFTDEIEVMVGSDWPLDEYELDDTSDFLPPFLVDIQTINFTEFAIPRFGIGQAEGFIADGYVVSVSSESILNLDLDGMPILPAGWAYVMYEGDYLMHNGYYVIHPI